MMNNNREFSNKQKDKLNLKNNKIKTILKLFKNKIIKQKLRKDIKKLNMINNKEIYNNKNIGSNIL